MEIEKRLLTADEVTIFLGLSTVDNVYQKVSRKQIPYVKFGRSIRFDKLALENWIRKNSIKDVEQ